MAHEPGSGPLTRLAEERAEAHRRYNDALTALDKAIQALPNWPDQPPPFDERMVTPVNEAWRILPDTPPESAGGWRGRLAAFVWDLVGPALRQQMAFNAALVDHLNRNVAAEREAREALRRALPSVREGFDGLVRFESLLVQFLQRITPLVDARERELADAVAELRHVAEAAQRAALAARRHVEQHAAAPASNPSEPFSTSQNLSEPFSTPQKLSEPSSYVGFEDRFRGSEAEIAARLADYVPYFTGASNVVDIGCGRGELLDLLKKAGISARGLDLNPAMVDACRARGLEADTGDALAFLSAQPDESLGGLIAIQVVEHLEPSYLSQFLQAASYKLRPGARMVLETINPACWVAFFESYIRDLTHVRPVHPDTLQYLLHASGFSAVDIVYRAPIAEAARLERVTPPKEHFGDTTVDPVAELAGAFNRNMDRLNGRLFTFQDYAAVARRP